MKNKKTYENLQGNIRNLKTPIIEVWENKYPDRDYVVDIETNEFTCVCPKTGLPDFATIKVCYRPSKVCIELKSFKLYLIFYRDVGIFHEHLVNKILDDLLEACNPRWMKVEAVMNPRGGIQTTVSAEYPQAKA
ncbi:MAG TPA: preQ(1) synthase [Candidatus Omnitrophota bacterium]|nr:preQ(1) synthase [Candidatus Omnitrophota bacterium]HPD84706.1 preQ(1) synthase [Candidatus Omnitrophota bacterium]HRZ03564.1 preQ(1) synthase [Candidatus Omnitrophota bacterium]